MNTILALSGVVIKELYRRKDFYVLFVLTAVITLVMGSVSFFHDTKIVRYVKEIALLLIWISALVIAIATTARQIPAERENRTIFPLLAKPVTRWQVILGKFAGCWLACGLALIVLLPLLRRRQRLARASLAAAELLPGALAAMGHAGRGRRLRPAGLGGLCRPLLQCHHLIRRGAGDSVPGALFEPGRPPAARAAEVAWSMGSTS